MSEVKEFEETEKVFGKLFFVPEEVEIMQTLGDEKEIGDEKLVKQLNAIVVGMSALIVLYTLWIAQRVNNLTQEWAFGPGRPKPHRASPIFGLQDRTRDYRDSRDRAESQQTPFFGPT